MKPFVIRTDAGPNIGTGHVMRCLALADALYERGGQVIFVMNSSPPALVQKNVKKTYL